LKKRSNHPDIFEQIIETAWGDATERQMPGLGAFWLVIDVQNDFCPRAWRSCGSRPPVTNGGDRCVPEVVSYGTPVKSVVLHPGLASADHTVFLRGMRPQTIRIVTAAYGPQVLWPDHCVQETPALIFTGH